MNLEISKELYVKLKYEAMLLGNISIEQLYKSKPHLFKESKVETKENPIPDSTQTKEEVKPEPVQEQEYNEFDDEHYHSFY